MLRHVALLICLMAHVSPTFADFGASVGDGFDYIILAALDTPENLAFFVLTGDTLEIPVGGIFTVFLESSEPGSNAQWGTDVDISITYNGTTIHTITGTGDNDGFFIDMDFEEYRTQRANYETMYNQSGEFVSEKTVLIETDSEIGVRYENDNSSPLTNTSNGLTHHSKYIYRYSKSDGALNYFYGEFHRIAQHYGQGSTDIVSETLDFMVEYRRVNYELPTTKMDTYEVYTTKMHSRIPWDTSWLVAILVIGVIYRRP